jgi:hypothetical protein
MGFGSSRSMPRVGHFHLRPLSRSGIPFCVTGARTDRWFADSQGARPQLPTLQVVPTEPFNQYDRLSGAVVKQVAKNATHCRSD